MLAHVPVVSQHTHRHVGGYFGQLPQDVVKCPAIDRITTRIYECHHRLESNYSSNTQLSRLCSVVLSWHFTGILHEDLLTALVVYGSKSDAIFLCAEFHQ